jgi:hypothetical protein
LILVSFEFLRILIFLKSIKQSDPVEVPKLELWESSAISAHWKSVEGIELAELARFSNIGF